MMKVGPALITGNTVVAKPAPTTPLTTLLFGELAADILPPGVLNIIVDANDLGGLLTSHPDVAKVAFTGSTATGKKVMESVSSTLKRLTLELGGNDAAIVLEDVDVKEIAPKIFAGAMTNSGQICLATKRVYAHASIYDELCDELARLAKEAVVDDGLKQGTTIGPLQNKQQYEKVKGFLEDAKANGKVIAGGEPLERDGYFIAPDDRARHPRQAPAWCARSSSVRCCRSCLTTTSRTPSRAPTTPNTAWAARSGRPTWRSGMEVASKIQSGTVWVNKTLEMSFDIPFRGAKQSGIGAENGLEGLEEYTQAKIINVAP